MWWWWCLRTFPNDQFRWALTYFSKIEDIQYFYTVDLSTEKKCLPFLFLFFNPPHTHTHTHTHSHTHTHTHAHAHAHALSHTHSLTHTLSHTLSHTLTLSHSHTLTLSHSIYGAKGDWDFRICDLVKNLAGSSSLELIFNPCDEFRWILEDPVSQIHFPYLHVGVPGIYSDLLRSVQTLKREWGAESNGKLPHLFIPSKSAALVLEYAVEDLPLGRTAALVPEFGTHWLYIYIYIYVCVCV